MLGVWVMGCRLLLGRSARALSFLAGHVVSVALHANAHSAVADLLNLHLQAAWFADSTSHLGKRFVIRFAPCGGADFFRIVPSLDIGGFDIQTDFLCVQRPSAVANMAVRQGFVFRRAGEGNRYIYCSGYFLPIAERKRHRRFIGGGALPFADQLRFLNGGRFRQHGRGGKQCDQKNQVFFLHNSFFLWTSKGAGCFLGFQAA